MGKVLCARKREARPFPPLRDEAMDTPHGRQNQDQRQGQGEVMGGRRLARPERAALRSPSLLRQTHCLQLLLGSFGQFRQIQAVEKEGKERPDMRDGLAPAGCLPSMQGTQGDETPRSHTKPPPPKLHSLQPTGVGTSETCTFAEI